MIITVLIYNKGNLTLGDDKYLEKLFTLLVPSNLGANNNTLSNMIIIGLQFSLAI